MTEKRFELLDETIFDNQEQAEDGGRVTYWVVEYQQRQELVELLNRLNEENDVLKQQLKTRYVVNKQYEELQRLREENKELKLQLEAFKDKLCELGVSDVKLYGKRYYTGLEEWLE